MTDLLPFQGILILIGLALVNAYLFSLIRQSPIVGYLTTGLLVGPYGFHLVPEIHEVEIAAEIGVILLLFTIGLEFSYSRISRLKGLLIKAGALQVSAAGLAVFTGTMLLGESWTTSASLAMAMTLSSTAIVLKLLLEHGQIDSAHGRISLGILLFQDLCVVVFLIALPLLGVHAQEFSAWTLLRSTLLMTGLFLFSRKLLRPLLRGILRTRVPELFRLTILGLMLGTAWVTAQAGLSLALGAFLAGLALAETDSSHQVLSDIIPFRDVFLAVFFISIGMLVDIHTLLANWQAVLLGVLLLSLAKVIAGTLAGLAASYPLRTALMAGLITFQVGEFSFILLEQALLEGALPTATHQLALSVVAITMMLTPLIFARADWIADRLAGWAGQTGPERIAENRERTANLEGHVIIAGYGLSGRNVARTLRELRIPHVHVETNGEAVRRARQAGEIILHGDATAPIVLEGAGIHHARALVLTINDPAALARAVPIARELNPGLYILARSRYVAEIDELLRLGADDVITDEFGAGLELSTFLLQQFSVSEGRVLKLLSALRTEHHRRFRQSDANTRNLTGYLSVLENGEIEIQAVPADSPCLGLSLGELDFRAQTGCNVVGLVRNERIVYNPTATLLLEPGDTLMLLGAPADILRARQFLHGHPI